jgi:hypothetical protein
MGRIDILTNTIPDSKTWKWSDELRETARGFLNICLEEHDGDLKIKIAHFSKICFRECRQQDLGVLSKNA